MKTLVSAAIAAVLYAVAGQSIAADTTTFDVKITILKACTITAAAATDVDFGSVTSVSTVDVDAQGSVTALCTPLTPYAITLNAGVNPGTAGDVATRRMINTDPLVVSNNYVAYQLYQDAARFLVWGDTGANDLAGTGTGLNQAYTVYGRVANPSNNNAAAGSYLDTITATIVY